MGASFLLSCSLASWNLQLDDLLEILSSLKEKVKQKYSLLPQKIYFVIWGKTVSSPELIKHYLTKTLVGNKMELLVLFLVVGVMWIVLLTCLPEYKVCLIDW